MEKTPILQKEVVSTKSFLIEPEITAIQEDRKKKVREIFNSIDKRLTNYIAENIEELEVLTDHEIVEKLIEDGKGWIVARNLEKFKELDHNKIAKKLIKAGLLQSVKIYLYKFTELDMIVADSLIQAGYWKTVIDHIENFEEKYHNKIAKLLIAIGKGNHVIYVLEKFKNLNYPEIANILIDAGYNKEVTAFANKFS